MRICVFVNLWDGVLFDAAIFVEEGEAGAYTGFWREDSRIGTMESYFTTVFAPSCCLFVCVAIFLFIYYCTPVDSLSLL